MTTSPPGPTTLTVRTTEDTLAIVPVAIGFHPSDSLVLVTFDSAVNMPPGMPAGALGGAGFHARTDLPTRAEDVVAVIEPIRQAVHRHRPRLGSVVVYSHDVELGRLVGSTAAAALARERMQLVDVVQVHDGQWWDLPRRVRAPRGWRPERHAVDVLSHPILAERVFAGQVVLGNRQEVVDSLRSGDEVDLRRVRVAVDRVADRLCRDLDDDPARTGVVRDTEVDWLVGLLAEPPPLTPDDVARVLTLAAMSAVRDRVCADLTRQQAVQQLPVWREVVRRAPPDLVAGAAAVLSLVAWLAGDGALAWCAVDRCHAADPGNTLAAHVAAALQGAVPPSAWERHRSAS